MKKCPTCQKTFEDSMRFCQSDGTPLVEAEAPMDPYKTMVARPENTAGSIPSSSDSSAAEPKGRNEDEVLQLPKKSDPLKTMYASEEEIRKEMASRDADKEQVIDLPPLAPEPPKFSEPSLSPPSFGDMSPPPSPFSRPKGVRRDDPPVDSPFGKSPGQSIPSPFSDQKPASYAPPPPKFAPHSEPDSMKNPASFNPFDKPSVPAEWTPPPAPDASWQNQAIGQNTPFQPPMAGTGGQNQTLAIVSLILGIVSIVFCQLTGPVAVVTGFMARRRAVENPSEYGGAGLGLAGIITGAIGTLLLVLVILYVIFVFGLVFSQGIS